MGNHKEAKENHELVSGFLKRRPEYDREKKLKEIGKNSLSHIPHYIHCKDMVEYLAGKTNFVQLSLLAELDKSGYSLTMGLSNDLVLIWNRLFTGISDDYTKEQKLKNIEEFEIFLQESVTGTIEKFIEHKLAIQDRNKDVWLDMAYAAYEENLIFG